MFFLHSGIPFVRFLIVFLSGIATAFYNEATAVVWLLPILMIGYLVLFFYSKKAVKENSLQSLLAWLILFCCGVVLVEQRTEKNVPNHFLHRMDSIHFYQARIDGAPEYTTKSIKLVCEVMAIRLEKDWLSSKGKILLYIRKDSSFSARKGDLWIIKGKPFLPPAPANPGQFDYAAYLNRQNIYAVHFLNAGKFNHSGHQPEFFITQLAGDFRNFCEQKLRAGIKDDNEYYLTVALLLGVRTGLDEKLYQAYSETGTVHALAVSGLHVALIYWIVLMVFGFLKRLPYGKVLFTFVSILIFWFYALVTGFSPSVVRAVAMFSVFLVAGVLKRNSGIYNVLAFSAFFILCIEPFWLMDIGFQFSFLAVAGIAYLYPVMYSWLELKSFLPDKLWSTVCVSIAAQLAVSPLSIYYFHSFPLLFLPFNLLIVPLSSLALYTGLGGLMVYKIPLLSNFCLLVTGYIVKLMNYLVLIPSGSSFLKLDFLMLSIPEVVLLYLAIVFFFFAIKNKQYKIFVYSVLWIVLFSISTMQNTFASTRRKIFTLYSIKDKTVLSFISGGQAILLSDDTLAVNDKIFRNNIYNHLAEERIRNISFSSFEDFSLKTNSAYGALFGWQDLRFLFIRKAMPDTLVATVLNNVDYLIVSDTKAYKQLLQIRKTSRAKVLIMPSVKEKSGYLRKDFYYLNRRGAYREEIEN